MQTRSTSLSESDVKQWWRHIKARNQLVFHLMSDEAASPDKLKNLQGFIQQLHYSYDHVKNTECPGSAANIRKHLLSTISNLIDSLTKQNDRQSLGSDVSFDAAKVDFTMVQHELLKQGIYE